MKQYVLNSTICNKCIPAYLVLQRFAYYTTIPVLIIQICLLALGIYAMFSRPRNDRHQDLEKTQGHQLGHVSNVRNVSLDSKSERSYQDSAKILGTQK